MTEENVKDWIGRQQIARDTIDANRAKAMAAMLNLPGENLEDSTWLPPLWHWLYFWEHTSNDKLAADGHAKRGGFLPPIDLPRRMWAGGEIEFPSPLRIGAQVERISRIENIENKEGKSGRLSFVTVSHEIHAEGNCCIREKQTIVYREAASKSAAAPPPARDNSLAPEADYAREIQADPLMLFRYSALTFNAHRIHYDREYVTVEEGYPGLLVHGPLMATLLAGLAVEHYPTRPLAKFAFRAVAPVFDLAPFQIGGTSPDDAGNIALWVANSGGEVCMKATAAVAF